MEIVIITNNAKLNLKVIATVLGHRSLNTTNKYVHVSLEATKEALKGRVA